MPNKRFIFCGNFHKIDETIELVSGVQGKNLVPSGNADLYKKIGDGFVADDFAHEQNLLISENEKMLLIAGCAHNGILNILERVKTEKGRLPDYVVGGFHLYNRGTKQSEAQERVDALAEALLKTQAQYYTCHCTGMESFRRLKAVMGENIDYLSTGEQQIMNIEGAGNHA
ncbi:MAG: MBL fold metallo-hydrolase [Candidatus Pelethousia sp.]|nr:MBL fold metallo-hydrolase [Candidatus Pelethousia sp.]